MLVGSHRGGINEMDLPIYIAFHIQRSLQFGKDLAPDTGLTPALKSAIDRRPLAIAFWQVSPGCPCPQHPDHAIEEFSMILRRPSTSGFCLREQWFDPLPLFIR